MQYLYMNETEEQIPYYQFPKFLLELPLSQNARIVYLLLYDRARISRKNKWTDEKGRVFVVFPLDELSQKTGKCKSSIKKALKELDEAGLLIRKSGGFPDRGICMCVFRKWARFATRYNCNRM